MNQLHISVIVVQKIILNCKKIRSLKNQTKKLNVRLFIHIGGINAIN